MNKLEKLNLFTESLYQFDKQDLEKMLIELVWEETTIDSLVDSVVEDSKADDWGKSQS
jgi:hypothetical protein